MELLVATGERMQRDAARLAGPAVDPGYDGDLVPCRVVMRKRSRFATLIKIRSLTPVAWRPWQPVISTSGYLGRLRAVVNDREAWVELMTSPDFAIGVEIERTGLLGVLRPRGDGFEVEMIGRDEDVRKHDVVITSGIAEIQEGDAEPDGAALTPRGLLVGEIATAAKVEGEVIKKVAVDPAATFDSNETVFVVIPLAGPDPASGGRS